MSGDLVFYTNPMSRSRAVRWMLEEIGQPYRAEVLQYGPAMKSPEYLAINPMGKVPAIRHGEVVVTECAAICAYLADAFPEAGLAPPSGDAARGPYYRWLFFGAGPMEAAMTNRALGVAVPDDKKGFVGYGSFDAMIGVLHHALAGGEYLAGRSFSAADIYVGSTLGWGMAFGIFERTPVFEAYWARIRQRPAALRAREIDDALMPPKPQST